jgi:hypothetical protein
MRKGGADPKWPAPPFIVGHWSCAPAGHNAWGFAYPRLKPGNAYQACFSAGRLGIG